VPDDSAAYVLSDGLDVSSAQPKPQTANPSHPQPPTPPPLTNLIQTKQKQNHTLHHQAAERSVAAIDSDDLATAQAAASSCAAALNRINQLQDISMANHGAAKREQERQQQGAGGTQGGGGEAVAMEVDGSAAAAEAAAENGEGNAPAATNQQQPDSAAPAAAAAARAAAAPALPPGCFASSGGGYWKPSWVRGGSAKVDREGEGEDEGGKKRRRNNYCKGIDPVFPMEDAHIIKVRVACVGGRGGGGAGEGGLISGVI